MSTTVESGGRTRILGVNLPEVSWRFSLDGGRDWVARHIISNAETARIETCRSGTCTEPFLWLVQRFYQVENHLAAACAEVVRCGHLFERERPGFRRARSGVAKHDLERRARAMECFSYRVGKAHLDIRAVGIRLGIELPSHVPSEWLTAGENACRQGQTPGTFRVDADFSLDG